AIVADQGPDSARFESVAAVVQRIHVSPREQIESVELVAARERDRRCSDFDIVPRVPGRSQAAGEVAIAVPVARARDAVDPCCALEPDGAREACAVGYERGGAASPDKAER